MAHPVPATGGAHPPTPGDLTRLLETERRLEARLQQVNTLERRLAPALRAQVTATRRALDEREREERLRLKRLKRSSGL